MFFRKNDEAENINNKNNKENKNLVDIDSVFEEISDDSLDMVVGGVCTPVLQYVDNFGRTLTSAFHTCSKFENNPSVNMVDYAQKVCYQCKYWDLMHSVTTGEMYAQCKR